MMSRMFLGLRPQQLARARAIRWWPAGAPPPTLTTPTWTTRWWPAGARPPISKTLEPPTSSPPTTTSPSPQSQGTTHTAALMHMDTTDYFTLILDEWAVTSALSRPTEATPHKDTDVDNDKPSKYIDIDGNHEHNDSTDTHGDLHHDTKFITYGHTSVTAEVQGLITLFDAQLDNIHLPITDNNMDELEEALGELLAIARDETELTRMRPLFGHVLRRASDRVGLDLPELCGFG
mmetsp:Transcript_4835/g.9879  ORF Transcript_4835/g.9879 Transcript_4835/m.9879 type:complete len:234 (+) Transcript_4835:108-809(+)